MLQGGSQKLLLTTKESISSIFSGPPCTLPGPLFVFDNGDFLTRRYLAAFFKLTLPNVLNINTHTTALESVLLEIITQHMV